MKKQLTGVYSHYISPNPEAEMRYFLIPENLRGESPFLDMKREVGVLYKSLHESQHGPNLLRKLTPQQLFLRYERFIIAYKETDYFRKFHEEGKLPQIFAAQQMHYIADMSDGALSETAHSLLAIVMNGLGLPMGSGEGGLGLSRFLEKQVPSDDPEHGRIRAKITVPIGRQLSGGRFGITNSYFTMVFKDNEQLGCTDVMMVFKGGQGAKAKGGNLPFFKMDFRLAKNRGFVVGQSAQSPNNQLDTYSIEDLQSLFEMMRVFTEDVAYKLSVSENPGQIGSGAVATGAKTVIVAGHRGGTGAAGAGDISNYVGDGLMAVSDIHQQTTNEGSRSFFDLAAEVNMRTGVSSLMSAFAGAQRYGLGTAALVSEGCVMAKKCHTTQRLIFNDFKKAFLEKVQKQGVFQEGQDIERITHDYWAKLIAEEYLLPNGTFMFRFDPHSDLELSPLFPEHDAQVHPIIHEILKKAPGACPVGVATQNRVSEDRFQNGDAVKIDKRDVLDRKVTDDLRSAQYFFEKTQWEVETYLFFLAANMVDLAQQAGFKYPWDAIGRAKDALVKNPHSHLPGYDHMLKRPFHNPAVGESLGNHGFNQALEDKCQDIIRQYQIQIATQDFAVVDVDLCDRDKGFGATLGRESVSRPFTKPLTLNVKGNGVHHLGAFLPANVTLRYSGVAVNDNPAMSAEEGSVLVFVHPNNQNGEQIAVGRQFGYGATGGKAYIDGVVDEQAFACNHGLDAVVVKAHGKVCQMQGKGRVIVLDTVGSFKGCTGGQLMVNVEKNPHLAASERFIDLNREDLEYLKHELDQFQYYTASKQADSYLAMSDTELRRLFKKYDPLPLNQHIETAISEGARQISHRCEFTDNRVGYNLPGYFTLQLQGKECGTGLGQGLNEGQSIECRPPAPVKHRFSFMDESVSFEADGFVGYCLNGGDIICDGQAGNYACHIANRGTLYAREVGDHSFYAVGQVYGVVGEAGKNFGQASSTAVVGKPESCVVVEGHVESLATKLSTRVVLRSKEAEKFRTTHQVIDIPEADIHPIWKQLNAFEKSIGDGYETSKTKNDIGGHYMMVLSK